MSQSLAFEAGKPLRITATNATLFSVSVLGVWVSAASSTPTLKLTDDTGIIVGTWTPTAGQFYQLKVRTVGTLTVTISGTVDCTVIYQ